jgi:hypothetical protein
MGIDFKCKYMIEKHEQVLTKATVVYFCELKGKSIRTCSGCKKAVKK